MVVDPQCIDPLQSVTFWGNLSTFVPSAVLFLERSPPCCCFVALLFYSHLAEQTSWAEGASLVNLDSKSGAAIFPYLVTSAMRLIEVFYAYAQFLTTFSGEEYEKVIERVYESFWGSTTSLGLLPALDKVMSNLLVEAQRESRQALGTAASFPFLTGFPTIPGFYRRSTAGYVLSLVKTGCILEYFAAKLRLAHSVARHQP